MLRITRQASEGVCTQEVVDAIKVSQEGGPVVVLLPSRTQVVNLQRYLAGQGLGLGVTVDTFAGWLEERWALLGDGRQPVDGIQRLLLMTQLLQQSNNGRDLASLGSARTLSTLAQQALPWIGEHAQSCNDLTAREHEVVQLLQAYEDAATQQGLVEQSRMLQMLPEMLERVGFDGTVLLAGFVSLAFAQRQAVGGIARTADVRAFIPGGAGAAFRQADALASQLQQTAQTAGANLLVSRSEEEGSGSDAGEKRNEGASPVPQQRDPELRQLVESLFAEEGVPAIPRTSLTDGAVELLMPAGPLAEARAVAGKIEEALAAGMRDIVVVAPNVQEAWQQLAPRMAQLGVETRASYWVHVDESEAGKAFIALADTVSQLMQAQEAVDARDGYSVQASGDDIISASTYAREATMGSMEWWPPRQAVDFLLSGISGVARQAAWLLDKRWRGTRALAPGKVLSTLCVEDATSKACARATSALVKGQVARAAAALLRPCEQALDAAYAALARQDENAQEQRAANQDAPQDSKEPRSQEAPASLPMLKEHVAVLAAIESAAKQVAAFGGYTDGEGSPAGEAQASAADVRDRVDAIALVASGLSVPMRPVLPAGPEAACVRILSPYEAARLEPCSCDCMIHLGLDTVHAPVGSRASAAALLLDKLGIEPIAPPIDSARWAFLSRVRVPRSRLVVERCAHGPSASDAYPAAMLAELLACYPERKDDEGKSQGSILLPEKNAPETLIAENLLPDPAFLVEKQDAARVGVDPRELLLLPSRRRSDYGDEDEQAQSTEGVGGVGEAQPDAPIQKGGEGQPAKPDAPAARVLLSPTQIESYLHCPQQWIAEKRLGLTSLDAEFGPLTEGTFAHAVLQSVFEHCIANKDVAPLDVFEQKFEEAFAQQFFEDPDVEGSGVLVPHCMRDDVAFSALHDNLRATLEFSAERLSGFEPIACELGFGMGHMQGHEGEPEVRLGDIALCGSIDRVDINRKTGELLVVDYKRSKDLRQYDVSLIEEPEQPEGEEGEEGNASTAQARIALPYHIQGLLYAWVLRAYAAQLGLTKEALGLEHDLKVVGAVYLGTGETRDMRGALDAACADAVRGPLCGRDAPKRENIVVQLQPGCESMADFEEYLDRFAEELERQLRRLVEDQDVAPRPWGNEKTMNPCMYCKVAACDARRAE